MEGSSGEHQDSKKKSPFEDLSREDLIKKCKNLLVIAQKAKQAKDETFDEVKKLQEVISGFELQKNADKEGLMAMQEIVERLTNDKLTLANEVEDYRRKLIKIEKQSKKPSEERTRIEFLETEGTIKDDEIRALTKRLKVLEKEIHEFRAKREEHDVEKFEAEEKVVNLEEQLLEKTNIITELQERLPKSADGETVDRLKSENFVLNEKIIQLETDNVELTALKNSLEKELESLKSSNYDLTGKLDDCLESRGVKTRECEKLSEITKDFERFKEEKETENETLKKDNQQKDIKITQLKDEMNECQKEINRLTTELEEAMRRQKIAETEESRQINELNRELESLRQEKEDEITDLKIRLENVSESLKTKREEINTMQHSIEVLNKQKQELGIEKLTEIENYKKEISNLEGRMKENDRKVNCETNELMEKLQKEVFSLMEDADKAQKVLKEKEDLLEEAKSSFNEANLKANELRENVEKELAEKLEKIGKLKEKMKAEKVKHEERIQEILKEKDLELEKLKLALNDEQKLKGAVDDSQKELQTVRKDADNCRLELNKKTEELKILKEKFEDEKNNLEKQIEDKDLIINDLKSSVNDSMTSKDVLEKLQNELIEKLEEIKRLKEAIDLQKSQFETQTQEISDKKDCELANLQQSWTEKLEELKTVQEKFESELKQKDAELETLRTALNDEQKSKDAVEEIQEELTKVRKDAENCRLELNEKIVELKTLKETFESEKNDLEKEIQDLKSSVSDQSASKDVNNKLKKELKEKLKEIKRLQKTIDTQKAQFETEIQEISSKKESDLQNLQLQLNKKLEELKTVQENFDSELQQKNLEVESLKSALDDGKKVHEKLLKEKNYAENCQQELTEKSEELKTIKETFNAEKVELEKQISDLNCQLTSNFGASNDIVEQLKQDLSHAQTSYENLQTELSLKLDEIKSLQESRDQQKLDLEKNIKEKESALEDVSLKVLSHKKENNELLEELKEINNILKERGEVISIQMSKISELEQSKSALENKIVEKESLQSATAAFEKQIEENRKTIEDLQKKLIDSQKALQNKNDMMNVSQSDALSTSTISKADESARLREIDESFEEKYNKMRFLAVKLKKKVADQTVAISKLEAEIANSKENPQLSNKKASNTDEQFLLSTLETKEQLLKQANEKMEQLQTDLTKAKAAIKKTSVLSLEMDSYEKSLGEVSKKLDGKKVEISELEATIKAQNENANTFKDQIRVLEEDLKAEKALTEKLKSELEAKTTKLGEIETENGELKALIDSLETEKEQSKMSFEESKLESLDLLGEKEKSIVTLEAEKSKALKSLSVVQEKFDSLTESLQEKQVELDNLKTEYASYKVRAQSVLKQSQSKDAVKEKELEEELIVLQNQHLSLEKRYKELETENDEIQKKFGHLESEKERVQARCDEFFNLVEEQRVSNETLLEEKRQVMIESDEALKAKRLEVETVRLCYEKEIQSLLEKHQEEINSLKKDQNVSQLPQNTRNDVSDDPFDSSRPNPFALASTDEQKINMILMQREEGEGSEHTSNFMPYRKSQNRNKHDLIPLDELLSSPFDESYTNTVEERPLSPTFELHQTREKLIVQETRVKHLSSLLSEAEQDLAKLTHLNEVLKEEVRRQQRSLDREQHTQNSEYLKNIVVKFLTLSSGNERVRLIPVLNTILKLSPEETQQLQVAAKGNEGLSRLTGMLPIWSNNN